MKYKIRMPKDVRDLCIAHVRGYDRRRADLRRSFCDAYQGGKPVRGTMRAEELRESRDAQSVEAVEAALQIALVGIRNREIREKLADGILRNCGNRYQWPYERLYIPTVGKKEFYRRKNDFLLAVAMELGYLDK